LPIRARSSGDRASASGAESRWFESSRAYQKKGIPTILGMPLLNQTKKLNYRDIYGSRTFFALLYVEGNLIAFIESFETAGINPGMMNKYIRAVLLFNETITLAGIKPLYNSIRHEDILLSKKFSKFQTGGCLIDKWIFPSERNRPAD
jgi:hypothetical protein